MKSNTIFFLENSGISFDGDSLNSNMIRGTEKILINTQRKILIGFTM